MDITITRSDKQVKAYLDDQLVKNNINQIDVQKALGRSSGYVSEQMSVRNGIRMSGVIDWKTQYELERMEDAGGKQKPLAELYKSVAESEDDTDEVERKVKEQALKYINSRNSTHVANAWIFLGLGIVLCVVVVFIAVSSDSMM